MTTRAELLAQLEEKIIKNKGLETKVNVVSELESADGGYDPYDNPGTRRELPDGSDVGRRGAGLRLRQR